MRSCCCSICWFSGYCLCIDFRTTPYTFFGPTKPITCPCKTSCPVSTIYSGDTWQYVIFILPADNVIVYPPPPKKPVYVIVPFTTAINLLFCGAPMSIPL